MDQFPDIAVTKTYSLTMGHIAKVADMAQRTGKSQGEIVRDAIDLLYKRLEDTPTQVKQQAAQQPAA